MHQKIGIIGGLSPESTVSYYLHITRSYTDQFGDHSYPEIVISSVNTQKIHDWRSQDRWDLIIQELADHANLLKSAGADFGLIATNTMHIVFDEVSKLTDLPLLNVMDEVAQDLNKKGLKTVALLGTKFTMSLPFYKERLKSCGIMPLVPNNEQQDEIHRIINEELFRGKILESSRATYLKIIDSLAALGAEGVILGCTEIPLLIKPEHCTVPTIDTALVHAQSALDRAISN